MENRDESVVVDEDVKPVEAASEFSEEEQAAIARGDLIIEDKASAETVDADDVVTANQPAKKGDDLIPRARFNEINEQLKAEKAERELLAAQIKELQARTAGEIKQAETVEAVVEPVQSPREQLKDLRQQARTALIEGDFDLAEQLDDRIDDLVLQMSAEQARSEQAKVVVAAGVNEVATAAIEKYPFLDSSSPDADPDAVNAVISRREELEAAGYPRATALQMAVDEKGPKFAKINGIELAVEPAADEAAKVKAAREKAAREKAAATSVAQPAMMPSKADKSTFAVDVNSLSAAQMKSLPEEEKARLRGDIL
jgi:hypothetical protein